MASFPFSSSSTRQSGSLHTVPTLLGVSLGIVQGPRPLNRRELYQALTHADEAYNTVTECYKHESLTKQHRHHHHHHHHHPHALPGQVPGQARGHDDAHSAGRLTIEEETRGALRPPPAADIHPDDEDEAVLLLLGVCEAVQALCAARLRRCVAGADDAHERAVYARARLRPRWGRLSEERAATTTTTTITTTPGRMMRGWVSRRRGRDRDDQNFCHYAASLRPKTVRFADELASAPAPALVGGKCLRSAPAPAAVTPEVVVGIRDVHGSLVAHRSRPQLRSKGKQSFDGWRNII